jgi:alkylated DNA nucleotide flippase Atl1
MADFDAAGREIALIAIGWLRGVERASAEAAAGLAALLEAEVVDDAPALRGAWQRKIARLPGLALERGMTGGEVSRDAEYDEANTYTVLAALEKTGLLEQVAAASPKRWRLKVQHRRDRILRASRVIQRGEWTTYGDIAVAVADNVRLARTVGRVAAKNPAFANPHRVLKQGGLIPPDWRDDDGQGPEECERRLRAEGVEFHDTPLRAAEPHVGWAEIKARLAEMDDEDDGAVLPAAA